MLILSQDKKHIYNFKNLEEIYISNEVYGVSNWCLLITTLRGDSYAIAYYDTEERAKEVLQDILEAYRYYRTAECDGYTNVLKETAVYEMPEK